MSSFYRFVPAALRPRSAKYEPLPTTTGSSTSYYTCVSRRRICLIVTFVLLASLAVTSSFTLVYDYGVLSSIRESVATGASWLHPSNWGSLGSKAGLLVAGPPTLSFKENLRNDTKYITTWAVAGWTNQVMTYINIIYLAMLTERVPIIPAFTAGHLPAKAGYMDFGVIFDVPRLARNLNKEVLEWRQVKNFSSSDAAVDELGCWSVWAMANRNGGRPAYSNIENTLKLDVAYTPVPKETKLRPNDAGDVHVSFWGMAQLSFPNERARFVGKRPASIPSLSHKHTLPPDDQLLCYDLLYYTGAYDMFEYEKDYSPAWRFVGRHVYWSAWIESVGDSYIRRVLGLGPKMPVPQYIGVHIRHTDFDTHCIATNVQVEECFAPLSAYARRVDDIRAELQTSPTFNLSTDAAAALPVIVTSDDTSQHFLDAVDELGWHHVDHDELETVETYGLWYGPIVDSYILSMGVGVVGTDKSTMSLLAQYRVRDWRGGVEKRVRWGRKDADAHRKRNVVDHPDSWWA